MPGRTAVCMTGVPRSLFMEKELLTPLTYMKKHSPGSEDIDRGWRNVSWAGECVQPEWPVACSIRNHVLSVLSAHGGYDLFVIEPGSHRSPAWDVIEPREAKQNAAAQNREPDRHFLILGGPEPDLWFDRDDSRWKKWFLSARYGYEHVQNHIQNLIYQQKHQADCNAAVRAHVASTGTTYVYKMRMRPDFAWQRDIPPLQALNMSDDRLLCSSSELMPGGNEDSFAVGLASPMDVYLDRYPFIHNFTSSRDLWTSESFAMDHVRQQAGIAIHKKSSIRAFVVRPMNFTRGKRIVNESVSKAHVPSSWGG